MNKQIELTKEILGKGRRFFDFCRVGYSFYQYVRPWRGIRKQVCCCQGELRRWREHLLHQYQRRWAFCPGRHQQLETHTQAPKRYKNQKKMIQYMLTCMFFLFLRNYFAWHYEKMGRYSNHRWTQRSYRLFAWFCPRIIIKINKTI